MDIFKLGFDNEYNIFLKKNNLESFTIGRVSQEHKERYHVYSQKGELDAEITGNLRFTAQSRLDFPVVGDWVTLQVYDETQAIIHSILPRKNIIKRKTAGKITDFQPIASNIDCAFIFMAVDRDFNLNRLERYLTICNSSGISSIVVLTKIDLSEPDELSEKINQIKIRNRELKVIGLSNNTMEGYSEIRNNIYEGKTYCLLGSSGVGKSTFINNLLENSHMKIASISSSTNKGRHTTSHRELLLLDKGIIIDNPGMRELGIADESTGIEKTFKEIANLSAQCKYSDCTHTNEIGCAILEALDKQDINLRSYENYIKMLKEKAFFNSSLEERKRKEKQLGKILKDYKKVMKKNN